MGVIKHGVQLRLDASKHFDTVEVISLSGRNLYDPKDVERLVDELRQALRRGKLEHRSVDVRVRCSTCKQPTPREEARISAGRWTCPDCFPTNKGGRTP